MQKDHMNIPDMDDKTVETQDIALRKPQLWKKGQSGNPNGRPKVIREPSTGLTVRETLRTKLGPAAQEVLQKVMDAAVQKPANEINKLDIQVAQYLHDKAYGRARDTVEIVDKNKSMVVDYSQFDMSFINHVASLPMITVEAEIVEDEDDG